MKLVEMNKTQRKEEVKKKIEKKNKETVNVIFAIDTSKNINMLSLKNTLKLLMESIKDYNGIYHLILFNDIINKELNDVTDYDINHLEDGFKEDNVISICNYDTLFKHIESSKVLNNKLFKCIIVTDGFGKLESNYNINTLWITGNSNFNPLFGEKMDLNNIPKDDNHKCNCGNGNKEHNCKSKDSNHKCNCGNGNKEHNCKSKDGNHKCKHNGSKEHDCKCNSKNK